MASVAIQTLSDFVGDDGRFSVHPAADLFPLIEGQEFERLVNSIREHGIQNPVVFNRDADGSAVLLDGRNRLRAAELLKEQGIAVNVPVTTFPYMDGITEVEWIEAQNIDRRHLTEDARAMLAASLHELIEADAAKAKKDSQFNADTAKAAAAKRHGKTATADTASPQKRDRKKSEARTTAAKVASNGKVSRHKAKQAIAAAKAIKAGAVSPDVRKDVIAGKKKLKDAVPTKPTPDRSKRQYQSIDDEIRFEVNRAWSRLRGKFAPGAEHKKLRAAMIALVRSEQKTFEK